MTNEKMIMWDYYILLLVMSKSLSWDSLNSDEKKQRAVKCYYDLEKQNMKAQHDTFKQIAMDTLKNDNNRRIQKAIRSNQNFVNETANEFADEVMQLIQNLKQKVFNIPDDCTFENMSGDYNENVRDCWKDYLYNTYWNKDVSKSNFHNFPAKERQNANVNDYFWTRPKRNQLAISGVYLKDESIPKRIMNDPIIFLNDNAFEASGQKLPKSYNQSIKKQWQDANQNARKQFNVNLSKSLCDISKNYKDRSGIQIKNYTCPSQNQ